MIPTVLAVTLAVLVLLAVVALAVRVADWRRGYAQGYLAGTKDAVDQGSKALDEMVGRLDLASDVTRLVSLEDAEKSYR